jgi:tRNA threonylcarbamoyladenosine biosynthesis protein TsaB
MDDMKKSWKRLAIDTATNYIYLCLIIDDKEIETVYEEGINNHSVTIMPKLDQLLRRHGCQLRELDEVIVGIGPGSYTGVRIGVAIAKMIGYLNQIKVQSVSSLALLASSASAEYVLPMIDARRNNAFMAIYQTKHNRLENRVPDMLAPVDSGIGDSYGDLLVVTTGCPQIAKILHGDLLREEDDIHHLVPNYCQLTEAERNRAEK